MKLALAALAFLASASVAVAQPPPRNLFEEELIHLKGEIVSADMSGPNARLHIVDTASGVAWVIVGPSSNTLRRGGLPAENAKGVVEVAGYKAKSCGKECEIRMRELTFPDGRKVFLGTAGT